MSFTTDVKNELLEASKNLKNLSKVFKYGIRYGKKDFSDTNIDKNIVNGNDSNVGIFLRGVFISCGIISDPNKEYHFEFTLNNEGKCKALKQLISEQGMIIKKSSRKGQAFLYTKDSEGISDILTYIGAMLSSMEIMNIKIVKDVRNNINRAVNCEAANIEKTVNAAAKQIEDINFIINTKGFDFLEDGLAQVAEIRINNSDFTLKEIGDLCSPSISKSGVNHRLKKISDIALKLRGE